tara:strand:- start:212 stop:1102 length:891 start_codon:yes stop_codon:yes gene_type:complete
MLPDNFDFAMLPSGSAYSLKEIGMLASSIETIDYAFVSWIKNLQLSSHTNEGFTAVPVLWQVPERAYQIKNEKSLRDDSGAIKLPVISIERTNIAKDPARKGGFQANIYSNDGDGRAGRMVIAKKIKEDKTRNFAVGAGTRAVSSAMSGSGQRYYPRINKRVVVQTLSIPIPIYVNVEYKVIIKSEYQTQMNDLVAPFMTRTGQINAFTMRRNGHLYEGFIDQGFNTSNNVAALGEELRMFTTEVNIRVLGYLIGEGENDDRPLVIKRENAVEITYPTEEVARPGQENLFGETFEG